jgi:hypothetical protein
MYVHHRAGLVRPKITRNVHHAIMQQPLDSFSLVNVFRLAQMVPLPLTTDA